MSIFSFSFHLHTQKCSTVMIEKFRKFLEKESEYEPWLTDLSKHSTTHFDFDMSSLTILQSCLTGKFQRIKINNSYSLWCLIKYVVPQGLMLCPILFNIFLSYMFFLVYSVDIACYVDNNTHTLLGETNIQLKTI